MKVIVPQIEIVHKLAKWPKKEEDAQYRPSLFSVSCPCEDGMLLYNTLSGEMLLLGPDETADENMDWLIRHGFYVPRGFDEHSYARQLRTVASMLNRKKNKTNFLVTTTTDCNAHCFYCFEIGCKRVTMTAQTAADAAAYMIRVSGDEELKLTWFGGEPLCNCEAIEIICKELKKAGKPFRSVIVSNGYYLDPETSKKAFTDWNLKLAQITLDGTKEIYQKTKAYKERDPNAYERVIRNIRGATESGISVLIRFNMDARNAEDLFSLADELKVQLEGCRGITAHCELLREYIGKINEFSSEKEAAETWRKLQRKLDQQWPQKKEGLPRSLMVNCCIADNDSCETILPDGNLSKCDRVDFSSVIGDLRSSIINHEEIKAWKEAITFPECETCPFFPQCIFLKRCKGADKGCSEVLRIQKRWKTEERMLFEYECFQNTGGMGHEV